MVLEPQAALQAPSTSTNVPGELKWWPEDEAKSDDENPNIGDDFDDLYLFVVAWCFLDFRDHLEPWCLCILF